MPLLLQLLASLAAAWTLREIFVDLRREAIAEHETLLPLTNGWRFVWHKLNSCMYCQSLWAGLICFALVQLPYVNVPIYGLAVGRLLYLLDPDPRHRS